MRYNLATAFAVVVKLTNLSELWIVKLTWFSPIASHQICLSVLNSCLWIHALSSTWPCLIIKFLATRVKFLQPSAHCTVINCIFIFHTADVFGCFTSIMDQLSVLLYGCTACMLTKHMEKKLDGNYTRMLQAILNESWRQHPTKQQLYSHLPTITKTIQVRRTRYVGHCSKSRNELISDIFLWTPSQGRRKAGRPAKTYTQQLCADTRHNLKDLPETMDTREGWWERVREICADGATWW